MNFISYEEFKNTDLYPDFIKENPDIGYLTVQAFTAYGAIPVSDTSIIITKSIEDYQVVFFQGVTNSSGIIKDIELPAPLTISAETPEVAPMYTLYELTAIHEGYESLKKYTIGMFGDVRIIQYVKMIPSVNLEGVDQNAS